MNKSTTLSEYSTSLPMAYIDDAPSIKTQTSDRITVVSNFTASDLTAKTFTADAGSDQLTAAGHGFRSGVKVQVSSSGTLPAGLSSGVDYYTILYDGNVFGLATSLANAINSVAINFTDNGSGTHTVTPADYSFLVKFQGSIDNSTWGTIRERTLDLPANTLSFAETFEKTGFEYFRVKYEIQGTVVSITKQQIQCYND